MELGFVILYVGDIDKAKQFYTESLGLSVVESASAPNFVVLHPEGGSLLALQDKTSVRLPGGMERQAGGAEVSFAVEDVDGTYRSWKDKGVEMVTEPADLPFGRYFMAKDPEGHVVSAYRLKG